MRKTYIDWILNPLLKVTTKSKKDNSDLSYDFFDANVTVVGHLSDKNKLIVNAFGGSDDLNISDKEILLDGYLKWYNFAASAKLQTSFTDNLEMEQTLKVLLI